MPKSHLKVPEILRSQIGSVTGLNQSLMGSADLQNLLLTSRIAPQTFESFENVNTDEKDKIQVLDLKVNSTITP